MAGDRPVIATVMRPTAYWVENYPYGAEAPFVDAFAPMVYWSCTEPGAAVDEAVNVLSRWRPVAPIGEDYDMGSEGGPPGLPSPQQIWRFLDVAHRLGSVGASLYDLETVGSLNFGRWPSTRGKGGRGAFARPATTSPATTSPATNPRPRPFSGCRTPLSPPPTTPGRSPRS